VSRTYLRGLSRRRVVPLAALAALVGGVLISQGGGSPVGAAPKSSHAKPVSSKVKGAKVDAVNTPLSVAQAKAKAKTAQAEAGAQMPTKGPVALLLELNTTGAQSSYNASLGKGKAAAKAAARTQQGRITGMQNSLATKVAQVAPKSRVIYRMHNIMAGLAVQTDARYATALKNLANVKAVYPILPKTVSNAGAEPLVGAPTGWAAGETGAGTTIGIIDSGIDYTHANFGGPGTVAAFDAIDRTHAIPGQFPTAKVIGGFDFAGDDYNADPTDNSTTFPFQPVPHPDPNPIDCKYSGGNSTVGHGSHVAGTAGGFGVASDGSTYNGPYDTSTPFSTMKIGPGAAPKASLYALRVFGCAGSTNVVGEALDWAADPNQDGDPSDRLDVVNMSLGSDFGSPQDADSVASNALSQLGTVVVAAMGNGGDLYDVGGSPGNAVRAIAASGSDDGFAVLDGLRVNSPAPIASTYGAELSIAFPYATSPDLTGVLADIPGTLDPNNFATNNKDGCEPLTPAQAAAVNGKIAFLEWTDDSSNRRCGSVARSANVKAAGAIGFVFADDEESFAAGITGDEDIPGVLIVKSAGDAIRPHLGEGVNVTLGNSLRNTVKQNLPQDVDKVYSASSRGTHGNGNLKPDVTGVAVQVFSTDVGTGSDGKSLSGTSMATPMIAGISALVRQKHPDWTPEEVKADLMNTADKDIFTGDNHTGDKYAPNRDGAGRVDVPPALDNQVLAYVVNDPGAVSVSFGPVAVTGPTTITKTVKVVNKGVTSAAFDISYLPATQIPGVSYSVKSKAGNPADNKIVLGPRGTTTFDVTLNIPDPSALTKTIDPTVDTEQAGVPRQFIADASGRIVLDATDSQRPSLRVPVYSAPRPASAMTQAGAVVLPPGSVVNADLALTGRGVGQGDGTEAIDSIVSGYALEATSPQLPNCTAALTEGCVAFPDERSTDVKYLGATTDLPQVAAGGGNQFDDGFLYLAVSSYGPWRTPAGFSDFEVFVDTNGDGDPDVDVFTTRFPDTDVFGVQAADLHHPTAPPLEDANGNNFWFLNTLDGSFDTDIFDSDSEVLPVPVSALGITSANRRIKYGLATFSPYHNEPVDLVGLTPAGEPQLTIDVTRPAIIAGDGASAGVMFSDQPGLALNVRKDVATYRADGTKGLLLIHHHNNTGLRSQVVKVQQPSTPHLTLSATRIRAGTAVNATVTIPASAGPAATGGIQIARTPGVALTQGTTTNGTLTLRLPNLPRGTWTIYSHYLGDNNYTGAFSNSVVLTVT
jgi:subtilisin family serine protease